MPEIKVGDLVRVMSSNDSIIEVAGYGVIESLQGWNNEPDKMIIAFNFMTPFVHTENKDGTGAAVFVDASGGPVTAIDKEKIKPSENTKTTYRHIYDGQSHAGHNLFGYDFDVPVKVNVHDAFLGGQDIDPVFYLHDPVNVDSVGLKVLNVQISHEKAERVVSLAGDKEALDAFAKPKNLKPIVIVDNARVTRAYVENSKGGKTIYHLNCNYPRQEFPWNYKE